MKMFRQLTTFVSLSLLCLITTVTSVQAANRDEVIFFFNDHLGSAVAAVNEAGELCWSEEYTAYGDKGINDDVVNEIGCGIVGEERGFTGHTEDMNSDLVYMQQRYYDPSIGRFLSIDPVDSNPNNPMTFNRYAYANNNPYKYIDPDGEFAFLIPVAVFLAKEAVAEVASKATGGASELLSVRRVATKIAKAAAKKLASLSKKQSSDIIPDADGGFSADLSKSNAKSRSGHRNAGNKQLNDKMKTDPEFKSDMERRHGSDVFDRTSTSGSGRRNPQNTEWDHNSSDPNRLDLRTKGNHQQKTRAEGQTGGGWKRFHRD